MFNFAMRLKWDKNGLGVMEKVKELREINAGDWQGKTFNELQTIYADRYAVWLENIGKKICPNGETVRNLSERIWAIISKIVKINTGRTIVVVMHATPIRTLYARFKGLDVERLKDVSWVSNASVSEILIKDDQWILTKESIDEYLVGMQTRFPANV